MKKAYLDVLVNVVVNVLASNSWHGGCAVLTSDSLCGVLEAGLLGSQLLLDLVGVVMLEVAVLNTGKVVVVLLWENLGVLYRLHRGVVVVLVHLLVNCGCDAIFLLLGDGLVGDSWVDLLVDSGVMLAILADEALDCVLGGVHIECD